MNENNFTIKEKTLAWFVHVFTATGVVFGLLAIIAISKHQFILAMFWLIIAFIVDGVDGMMARKFKVKEVLPFMEGKNIDFVIDFANYAIIPAYFLYEAFWIINGEKVHVLPNIEWVKITAVSILLLVSALYYGKEPMVSEDMYFIGFPVMWNAVIYFMFFVTYLPAWINFGFVLFFAILHFVPLKYTYPSQNKKYQILNWVVFIIFIVSTILILWNYPNDQLWMRILSGMYLPFFIWSTLWASFKK